MSDCRNKTGSPGPDACSKYCTDHPFPGECNLCGVPIELTYATLEVVGPYCDKCFGYGE